MWREKGVVVEFFCFKNIKYLMLESLLQIDNTNTTQLS